MRYEKIRKELSKHCSSCKFNSCFREDECYGCVNNEYFAGKLILYELRVDLEEELNQVNMIK